MNNSTPHIPMSTQQALTPGEKAIQCANSIAPFIMHPPSSKDMAKVMNAIAMTIQKFGETYWPDMKNERDEAKAYLIPELEEEIRRLKKENENLLLEHGRISDEISILGSEYHGIKQAWNTLSKLKQ